MQDKIQEIMGLVDKYHEMTPFNFDAKFCRSTIESKLRELGKDADRWHAVTRDSKYCGYVVVEADGSRDCALDECYADSTIDNAMQSVQKG